MDSLSSKVELRLGALLQAAKELKRPNVKSTLFIVHLVGLLLSHSDYCPLFPRIDPHEY